MQTRRDQLQAYRFQNRRALAALVTGEPNVVEPPMRRLTITTISGIMIAILIAVGFALFGLIKPSSGSDWKKAGVIIVERGTYSRYVYIDKVLHPVLNYSSAVLALGTTQKPATVMVNASDLSGATRGPTIGIDGAPDELPSAGDLVHSPFSICSRLEAGHANQLDARVSISIGDTEHSQSLPSGGSALVQGVSDHRYYVLYGGQRLEVGRGDVLSTLHLDGAPTLQVGTTFLDGVPAGQPLQVPQVAGAGAPYPTRVSGHPVRVGQLLRVSASQYYLVVKDGKVAVNPLESELLQALPLAGGHTVAPLDTDEQSALSLPDSPADGAAVTAQMQHLPAALPTPTGLTSQSPGGHGGVCAVYANRARTPSFAVPPSQLPSFSNNAVTESSGSQQGRPDAVDLAPGAAALVRYQDGSSTTFLVADPGRRYAVASADVLAGFGYADVHPALIAPQLLTLIPKGPALIPSAARRPVTD